MQLSVTRRQYTSENELVSSSTFHWIKDEEGSYAWSEVGDYGEHYNNLGHEIMISYRGQHWELELVKTVHPNQVFVDVILSDPHSHDQYFFNEDGYDQFVASAFIDATLDHDNTTRVFWSKCHDMLDHLLEAKENVDFLTRLNICHQVYETEKFPGFGFRVEKPVEQPVAQIDAEITEKGDCLVLRDLTIDKDGNIFDRSGQPLQGEWTHGPFLGDVGVTSEGITPPDNSPTNDPPVDTSSDDGQPKYGVPIWIAAACEYEVEDLIDDEIQDQKEETITVGSENNT